MVFHDLCMTELKRFQQIAVFDFTGHACKICHLFSCSWKVKRSRSGLKKGKRATCRTKQRDSQIRSVNNDFNNANTILCCRGKFWNNRASTYNLLYQEPLFYSKCSSPNRKKNIGLTIVCIYQSTLCVYLSQVKQKI